MKVSASDHDATGILNWIAADMAAKSAVTSVRPGRVDTGTFGPAHTAVITMKNGQRFRADLSEMFEGEVH